MATSNAAQATELINSSKTRAKSAFKPFIRSVALGILGALVGKGMGRGSFLAGAAVTFAVHMRGASQAAEKALGKSESENVYDGDSSLIAFGLGMMFGGSTNRGKATAGSDKELEGTGLGLVEGATERLRELKDDLIHRLYADKLTGSKTATSPGTVGAVTFYGNAQPNTDYTFDPKTLDEIERNLQQNAIAFERNGNSSSVSGFDGNSDSLESRLM
jgi:hypothetical protein